MANIIQHKRSSTSGVAPAASGLSQGELAINIADGKLYTKNNNNTVINLGVTSISGTYITPASGNFSDSLKVNGIEVSVSGHNHDKVTSAGSLSTAVFNKTGSTIPKFSVVYINGGQGDQPTINLAIANSEAGSSKTYGVTAEAISHMSSGTVIVAGALTGINTDQFNPTAPTGDVNGSGLWLSPSTSGSVTLTKPTAPNHMVYVGTIVRTHQNAGVVEVRIQNGFELEELHNVAISGVTDGQFLQYNSSSGLWVASSSGNFTTLNVNNTGVVISSGGTSGYLSKFTNSSTLNSSVIYQSGNNIGIGTVNPLYPLQVIGTGNIQNLQIGPLVSSGAIVSYTHPDYTELTNIDIIISGQLELTRGNANGIYNIAVESAWSNSVSPSGTEWNNDGWSNITNLKTRTYDNLYDAVGGGLGYNLPNAELIMRHIPTDRYWKIKFSSWTQGGGGGGFAYTRQEVIIQGDAGSANINSDTSINGNVTVNGSLGVSSLSLDSLGIGTNSPGSVLTVSNAGAAGTIAGASQTQIFQVTDASNSPYINLGHFNCEGSNSRGSFMLSNNSTGGWQDNVMQFMIHGPSYGYGYYGGNTNDAGCAILSTQGSSIEKLQIGNYGSAPIEFFTANTFRMRIASNGDIGINTASPAYKLDVNGTANIATSLRINAATTGTIASFDSSKNIVSLSTATYPSLTELSYVKGVTSALQTQLNAKQATLTNPITGTGTTSYLPKFSATSTLANSLIYDNGTNVGIGTTSPSTKLHVNGFISQSAVHASAGLSTDQTITANSDTVIQLTDKDDPNNWWNASTYRFLPTVSGYYFIAAQVNWDPGAGTGQLNIQIRRNGTTVAICQNQMVSGVSLTQNTTAIVNLNGSSDYVDLTGYTGTTNASQVVNGTADRAWTKLEAYKIS